jgi:GNAT superfamily N-acetyltransferase
MTGDSTARPAIVTLPWRSGDLVVRHARPTDDVDLLHQGDRAPQWNGQERLEQILRAKPPEPVILSLVAERDSELVGHMVVLAFPLLHGGMGSANAFVPVEHRGTGAGRALLTVAARQRELSGLPGVRGWVDASDSSSRAALAALGGHEEVTHVESELDLTALDREALFAQMDRAHRDGIRLATLPPDATEEQWSVALRLHNETMGDAPDAGGQGQDMPMEVFRATVREPWMVALAWDGDRAVGLTSVARRPGSDVVNTMLTGVVRDARGRGIATALKADHAQKLADRGLRTIVTQNMDGNTPILAANARLGFTPARTWIEVALPAASDG